MIKKLIWIDKNVNSKQNKVYKSALQKEFGLEVKEYDNTKLGIEAIKNEESYSPIFIITSGSIYPEFYNFFKSAVTYIKNLPVQIIFTSSITSFLNKHKNDEIGQQIGKFYNLGGVNNLFSQVRDFIIKTNNKLQDFQVKCSYSYKNSKNFSGLQTFSYIKNIYDFEFPSFFLDIINNSDIEYEEISTLVNFMLTNFGNERMSGLLKGMILFNDIPEPILSKFFARAYTLESPFYGIMNQNLMKKNFEIYSTYIKLLYKGIKNESYQSKRDCTLYRGTKLEKFEIEILKDILKKKRNNEEIPIIYSTSFLSFSKNHNIAESLKNRRKSTPENKEVVIKLLPLDDMKNYIMETNAFLKEISYFHYEDEVLFFPYSFFELVDIKESSSETEIVLEYSLGLQ